MRGSVVGKVGTSNYRIDTCQADHHLDSLGSSTNARMMVGINDIGWPGKDAITPSDPEPTAEDVIQGYKQIIDRAHDHGIP
jgi:hypothetical protein